jgi:hypothetical protein
MGGSIWGPVTSVHREFEHRDGGTLRIEITANGPEFAAGVVKDTAGALTECPVVTDESGGVTRHAGLPLPALGDASAGLNSVTGDRRTRTAVVAWGPVHVGVEEAGDGDLVGYGTPGVAVQRTFARGDSGTAVVESVVGTTGEGQALVEALRRRVSTCPAVTDEFGGERVATRLNVPATDITIDGVLYRGDPVRARAVFVYRDVCAEVWITQVPGLTLEQIEKIVENALGGVFDVYHG